MKFDQLIIFFCSVLAIHFISEKRFKIGSAIGLLGQPFWMYSSWFNDQWGIFLLSLWYGLCYFKMLTNVRLFYKSKDGGEQSHVWGYWLIEAKWLFSIALLRFEHGTREVYHSHAFNSISWVLKGKLEERHLDWRIQYHVSSLRPIITRRDTFHQVFSHGQTWVLTFRGPWSKNWKENVGGKEIVLTHGRKVV